MPVDKKTTWHSIEREAADRRRGQGPREHPMGIRGVVIRVYGSPPDKFAINHKSPSTATRDPNSPAAGHGVFRPL